METDDTRLPNNTGRGRAHGGHKRRCQVSIFRVARDVFLVGNVAFKYFIPLRVSMTTGGHQAVKQEFNLLP